MAGSISRTGMDEFEAMCLRAPDTTSGQAMVCGYDEAALPYDIVGARLRQ
jgi:hypothetical protein